jgi:hypothetical protein
MKMAAACSSKMLVCNQKTAWHNNSEDNNLKCFTLKSWPTLFGELIKELIHCTGLPRPNTKLLA